MWNNFGLTKCFQEKKNLFYILHPYSPMTNTLSHLLGHLSVYHQVNLLFVAFQCKLPLSVHFTQNNSKCTPLTRVSICFYYFEVKFIHSETLTSLTYYLKSFDKYINSRQYILLSIYRVFHHPKTFPEISTHYCLYSTWKRRKAQPYLLHP